MKPEYVTLRHVACETLDALEKHLMAEQEEGRLDGWTATADRECEALSLIQLTVGRRVFWLQIIEGRSA